jgi:hypothetical protein
VKPVRSRMPPSVPFRVEDQPGGRSGLAELSDHPNDRRRCHSSGQRRTLLLTVCALDVLVKELDGALHRRSKAVGYVVVVVGV